MISTADHFVLGTIWHDLRDDLAGRAASAGNPSFRNEDVDSKLPQQRSCVTLIGDVAMDAFDIYTALWDRARSAGACVQYFEHPRADPPSLRRP